MTKDDDPADYEVGYGKPPKHGQFKKGQSGNPKGRPKGSHNLETDVRSVLNTRIAVNEGGKTRKVSTQLATLLRLKEKALKGDSRSLDRLLMLAADHNNVEAPKESGTSLSADDAAIVAAYEQRILSTHDATPESLSVQKENINDHLPS
jgi:Family of unknown function (DUF5681)